METSANRLSRRQLLRRRTSALLAGAMGAVALSCVLDQPAGPADPKEPVQLRVLVPRVQDALVDPLPDWMEAAVKEVNATEPPSYRLSMHALETRSAEWSQKVNELRSAGASSVDLLAVHLGDVPALQSSQALLSLESYRKRERSLDLNDYYRPVLAAHSWQDRLYALPFIASPLVMYYPPDLFAAANLLPPSTDWRWDDLVVTATALTRDLDGDGRADQWGYLQLPGSPLSVQYIWQNGGAVLGPNNSVRLDEPAALEAVAFMASLIQEARVSPSLHEVSLDQMGQLLQQNRAGLFQFHLSHGIFWRSPPLNLNLVEPPRQRQPATTLTTSGLSIGAEAAHPDEAWTALRTLTASLERRGLLPPRKSLAGSLRQIEPRLTDGDIAVMQSALDYARAPAWERYHEVLGVLLAELDMPILLGAKSPETAVRDASDALRQLL